MRRDPLRDLRRRVEQGDVHSAERLLFEVARRGMFFVPGSDYKVVNANSKRAYWVRLLGWLKWSEAETFQADVAAHVAPFDPESHATEWDPSGRWSRPSVAEALHSIKPFSKIGEQIAGDIGVEIMQVLGSAAARAVVHLCLSRPSGEQPAAEDLEEGIQLGSRLAAMTAGYRQEFERGAKIAEAYERHVAVSKPLENRLYKLESAARPYYNVDQRSSTQERATHAAHTTVSRFIGSFGRHRSDQAGENAEALFWALYALAWECESEKPDGGVALQRGDRRWPHYGARVSWSHTAGVQPSRSCMTKANRRLKAELLPSALMAVALEVTR